MQYACCSSGILRFLLFVSHGCDCVCEWEWRKKAINSIIYLEHYLLALILSVRKLFWASCHIHFGTAAPDKQVDNMKSMIHSTCEVFFWSFQTPWIFFSFLSFFLSNANGFVEWALTFCHKILAHGERLYWNFNSNEVQFVSVKRKLMFCSRQTEQHWKTTNNTNKLPRVIS